MVYHYRTIDCGIKLSSFAGAPTVHDVGSMDKMLTAELNRLVTHEHQPDNDEQVGVGHVLSTIFQSFDRSLVPQASSLQVPLSKIHYRDDSMDRQYGDASPGTQVTLYNIVEKRWNFPLPKSNTVDSSLRCLVDSDEMSAETKSAEHIFASFLNTLRSALLHDQPKLHSNMPLSTWHANFAKEAINDDIHRKPDLILSDTINPDWGGVKVCAEITTSPYKPGKRVGKELDTRAFLMTRKQPWRRFVLLLSFTNTYQELRAHVYDRSGGVVSPSFNIHKNPDILLYILACLCFGKPTCVGFDHTITFFSPSLPSHPPVDKSPHALKARETRQGKNEPIHPSSQASLSDPALASSSLRGDPEDVNPPLVSGAIDESPPQVVDADPFPNTTGSIGTIRVNDTVYDIIKIIFSSRGLVGRGTICYLVRHDDRRFVIKDHWVLGDEGCVKNEMDMLARVKGIPGVPELVDFCIVQTETGTPDKTSAYRYSQLPSTRNSYRTHVRLLFKPCARPLHMFDTKHELIQALRDVVSVQEQAVLERNVLHRDSSLFNIMIEDRAGRGRGMLIDWEFAVTRCPDDQYDIGGTGTIPFMSRKLLSQVVRSSPPTGSEPYKSASASLPTEPRRVTQTHRDDLESLFYVFLWICIKFKGPCGMERQLDSRCEYLPLQWTTKPADAAKAKVYFLNPPMPEDGMARIDDEFAPYFHDLRQLAREWYGFVATRLSSAVDAPSLSPETIKEDFRLLLGILDKSLTALAAERPGEYVKAKIVLEETAEALSSKVDVHNVKKRPCVGPAQTMEPSKRAKTK